MVRIVIINGKIDSPVRKERWNGREYLVAPSTLIVPGVLDGSEGPLLYPPDEVVRNISDWNGMPLVAYHPMDEEGNPLSARDPSVLENQGIGYVFRANIKDNSALAIESWFDVEKTKSFDENLSPEIRILPKLLANKPIELSTGLYTENSPADEGSTWNGVAYKFVARNYKPDHVAILPDEKGACSIENGCGVLNTSSQASKIFLKDLPKSILYSLSVNAWSEAARAAALEARRAKMQDKASEGGGGGKAPKGKATATKIKAAADKVTKITAKVEKAKATLSTLKSDLKAAKVDLKELKGSVKAKTAKSGELSKGDLKAISSSSRIAAMSDEWVAPALQGKPTASPDQMKATIRKELKGTSVHKVAKEMGIKRRFKSVEEATKAIEEKVVGRIGTAARPYA